VPPRTAGPFPTADEIAERAYELFLAGGRRVAMIPVYWREAERELLRRGADRFIADTLDRAAGSNRRGRRPRRDA
jgi:hypothetical protein